MNKNRLTLYKPCLSLLVFKQDFGNLEFITRQLKLNIILFEQNTCENKWAPFCYSILELLINYSSLEITIPKHSDERK